MTIHERFWSKVDRRAEAECWPWKAGHNGRKYGAFQINGRSISAHRAAWILTFGEIPVGDGHHGICVLHSCDNAACCNPSHLHLGTQAENTKERDVRGRTVNLIGSGHGMAKLVESDVSEILTLLASGLTHGEVARRFNVSRSSVWSIGNRRTWRHVEGKVSNAVVVR